MNKSKYKLVLSDWILSLKKLQDVGGHYKKIISIDLMYWFVGLVALAVALGVSHYVM